MMELESILKSTQEELKMKLSEELHELGYSPTIKDGFLYAKGNTPVLLVAHLDTVHREIPKIICYSNDGQYVMSPQGIGGDDRSGIFMILQIIRQVNCHVLFCEDEETGGHGARKFTKSGIDVPVNYIIELDRRGDNDAVFYECDNPEFTKHICDFGFDIQFGSFSDISILAPALGIAAVNISAGYYNAHRENEYIDFFAMKDNINRIIEMTSMESPKFNYKERERKPMFGKACKFPALNSSVKHLMSIPNDATLIVGDHMVTGSTSYMIDSEHNVYLYLPELSSAIESESSFACDGEGNDIPFIDKEAKLVSIISFDEALQQLSA